LPITFQRANQLNRNNLRQEEFPRRAKSAFRAGWGLASGVSCRSLEAMRGM
jgi:hypothetical protein